MMTPVRIHDVDHLRMTALTSRTMFSAICGDSFMMVSLCPLWQKSSHILSL
jgi:hypothetical protein